MDKLITLREHKLLRDALNSVDELLAELSVFYQEHGEAFSLTDSGEAAIAVLNQALASGWVDLATSDERPQREAQYGG